MNSAKSKHLNTALAFATVAGVFVIFHFMGNTAEPDRFTSSTFIWTIKRWSSYGGYFTFGYFIPFISLWLVWKKWTKLRKAEINTDPLALVFVIGALLLQLISARTSLPRLSVAAFICLTFCIPWYIYGRRIARHLIFPCAYLIFCIPLNFLERMTFPLRLIAASASSKLLNGAGINNILRGTGIFSVKQDGFKLDVADPCSGLKYFLVLLALSALYAYITQNSLKKKWLLFCTAAPIAIMANIIRITAIALAAEIFNPQIATTIYHDFSGYIVFVAAVIMLMACAHLININYKEKLKRWKQQAANRT